VSYCVLYSEPGKHIDGGDSSPRRSNTTVIVWLIALVIPGLAPVTTTIYRDAYPDDFQKRIALDQCSATDRDFSRFFAAERNACYQRLLATPPNGQTAATPTRAPMVASNFVDLWRAAGGGHLPANDVRAQAQTAVLATVLRTAPR
jgi:hypothetical protein